MKDKLILLGWIAGLLLLISVLWILVQPALTSNLMRTVNTVFASNNDSRRVSAVLHPKTGRTDIFGYWYTLNNSANKLFVFTIFNDGILIPLGAEVAPDASVKEILPLSAHAEQVFDSIPKSVLRIYIEKIEDAAYVNFSAQQGVVR
jgi:hypothetical protein